MKATRYGVENLKMLMAEYDGWITSGDDDFEFRTEILESIINQLAMYIQHVYLNVGGLYKNEVKADDTLPAFANIPTEKQLAALDYLCELYGNLDWLDNKALLNKLAIIGSPKAAVYNMLGSFIILTPFSVSLTADVAGNSFSFRDCADRVYDYVWKPTRQGRKLTREQMDLQRQYVEIMMRSGGFALPNAAAKGFAAEPLHDMYSYTCNLHGENLCGEINYDPISGFGWFPRAIFNRGQATVADIYAYMSNVQTLLKSRVNSASAETKAHYELLLRTIELGLK